jgi:hypothetical protein
MSNIDFPDSPQENDTFAVGSNMWKYNNGKWSIVIYTHPKYGIVDGNNTDSSLIRINGGSAKSNFGSADPLDSGSIV